MALGYLQARGFELIQRNFRSRMGEIDIIGIYKTDLLFIEVRSKSRQDYGNAAESVTVHKQQKIIRTAQFFLHRYSKWATYPCRFDIIAVTLGQCEPTLEWIENAFC